MALENEVRCFALGLKSRTGGLLLSTQIEGTIPVESGDILFATSTFSLCELLSLHPELQKTHKVMESGGSQP